jgi:hypothetical protein
MSGSRIQAGYHRERLYQRAVSALLKTARRKRLDFFAPSFHASQVRHNVVILKDERGEKVAVFKVRHNGKLTLIEEWHEKTTFQNYDGHTL